jgi:general secretion pathway protein D
LIAINPPPESVIKAGMIRFEKVDLEQVLRFYAELIKKTILRPAVLPAAQISLTTQTDLSESEAKQALDAVLALNGITIVDFGPRFVKVVPAAQAPSVGPEINTNSPGQLASMGQFVTRVHQLKYTKPSEVASILQPFASQGMAAAVTPIEASQILVLRDYSENIKRMMEMIDRVDVNVPSEFTSEVIPIKYALASEIAGALNSLSTGGGGTSIGSGSSRSTGPSTTTRTAGFNRTGMNGMGGMGMGGYPGSTMQGMGTTPGAATGMAGATPGGAGASFTDRLRGLMNKVASSGDIQVLGQTKIISDERTNSLLIYASKDDMKIIKDIIGKLDVVLAQVLIEAVIIEVSLDNSKNLGVSYQETSAHGPGHYFQGLGAINNGNMFSAAANAGTNLASGLPGGFSYVGQLGQDLTVTLTAVASDSRAKILQHPILQTSHAVPANIFVGETRPYPTGSYYGGGAYGGYSSIQQMQVGVSLDVTPLINSEGLVMMDIHQKIDSVSGTVNIANVGDVPITSSKEAQTKVAVRDRDTIMLGGLIEKTKNASNTGVPYLKDIPLLGFLFRASTKTEARNEMIVLIRPTVLPTPEVAALTAEAQKSKMPGVQHAEREFQTEENKLQKQMQKEFKNQ